MNIHDFIEEFRSVIVASVGRDSNPLYHPGTDRKQIYQLIKSLQRRPIASQVDAIGGIVQALRFRDSAILVGEMGLGKTYISIAAAAALEFTKILVVCPPHLVSKWRREVKQTIPLASVLAAERIGDLERTLKEKQRPLFVILSREKAKLGYYWKGHAQRLKDSTLVCPRCRTPLIDRDGVPVSHEALNRKKQKCKECWEPLWEADPRGPRRFPLATYLKNKYPGHFDLLISDECHEYKGAATAQGIALDHLGKAARQILALTGTLLGGYSSNLFYLLFRISPDIRKDFKFRDIKRWMELYGVIEKITFVSANDEGRASLKKAQEVRWHERPGISPALIPELLPRAIFLKLSDLNIALPPYREIAHSIDMEPEQKEAYRSFQDDLLTELRMALNQGSKRLLGVYLQALLGYSDSPWVQEIIKDKESGRVLAESTPLPENTLYPKEKELLRICTEAKRGNRKTVVYCVHTETRDITERLKKILGDAGLQAEVLKASKVKAGEREEWIQSFRGDVLITHPRNVQTGLDLIQFPEVVWYQQDYSVYIVRQASRRSWRIGQKEPVNVHHLYYKSTIQEKAITLNVKKLRAALLTEGELTDGQFLEQLEEDGLVALAKTIIDRAEEKISLESELRKLRGVEEETDMILPGNLELEEVVDEDFSERNDEPLEREVLNNRSGIEPGQEAVASSESRQERMQKRSETPSQSPTQLLLFAYVS
jgi:SNF2 family DNA or RNA helicase